MPRHRTAISADSAGRFTPTDVAALVGVTPTTVVNWCEAGRLPGAVKLPSERWRIPRCAFQHLLPADTAA